MARAGAQKRDPSSFDELERFAAAFDSEDALRKSIAELLKRMGREEVRITHGTLERGKDIVFYGSGGLDERTLYACVIKRERITGAIDSQSSAKEALFQAEQAFDEPYLNPNNAQNERVRCVYIMSPLECPTSALESIRDRLSRLGNVEFACGTRLLQLFARYWPDFLLFESTVLVSYLSTLRNLLDRDAALIALTLRQSILGEVPKQFSKTYVPQSFSQVIRPVEVTSILKDPIPLLKTGVRLDDIRAVERTVKSLLCLLQYFELSAAGDFSDFEISESRSAVAQFIDAQSTDWTEGYHRHLAELREGHDHLVNKHRSKNSPVAMPPKLPAENSVTIELDVNSRRCQAHERLEKMRQKMLHFIQAECRKVRSTNSALPQTAKSLSSSEVVSYCRLAAIDEQIPDLLRFEKRVLASLRFEQHFLDSAPAMLLLTGPAGFGKTSFCKWEALTSADEILEKTSTVLPVFIALYRFFNDIPDDPADAFFQSTELKQLISAGRSETRVRLFLDGLDEVADSRRQQRIVELARLASQQNNQLQVVITARDHVSAPWLDGIVRLQVDALDTNQQKVLIQNWLGSKAATEGFLRDLELVPSLKPLMAVPLLGTLVTAVYKRQQYLPMNKTALYSLFIELLCGGWDAIKGVNRGGKFGAQDKRVILARLAGMNHCRRQRDATLADFRAVLHRTLSGLVGYCEELLSEIVQDGVVVSTGGGIRFSHLSFQEFLAAEDLTGPNSNAADVIREYFRGDEWWREVAIFYVTRPGSPSDMEEWLIKHARGASTRSVSDGQKIHERLGVLRAALLAAYPSYVSQHPPDGVITTPRTRRRGGDLFIEESKRSIMGAPLDE